MLTDLNLAQVALYNWKDLGAGELLSVLMVAGCARESQTTHGEGGGGDVGAGHVGDVGTGHVSNMEAGHVGHAEPSTHV